MTQIKFEDAHPELLTDHDKEQARHNAIRELNVTRDRARRAVKNRNQGHAQPKPGDVLHVSLARGLDRRTRAGIIFMKGPSQEVKIVDASDDRIVELRARGQAVVNVHGAEELLEDSGPHGALVVRAAAFSEEDVTQQAAVILDLERQNRELRAQLEQERAELQKKREARRAAVDTGDGKPVRLAAARQAVQGAKTEGKPGDAEDAAKPDGDFLTDK